MALANELVGDSAGIRLLDGKLKARGQSGDLTVEPLTEWISALGWSDLQTRELLVLAVTGVANTCATLVLNYWHLSDCQGYSRPCTGESLLLATRGRHCEISEPDLNVGFIAFPGTSCSSPYHYGIFMRDKTALTSRLYQSRHLVRPACLTRPTTALRLPAAMPGQPGSSRGVCRRTQI